MRKILFVSLILFAASAAPLSFAWDGSMAMDADKRNVDLGQIITYEGYLYGDYPIDGKLVSITVYEKETKRIILTAETAPGTKSVDYFENTAWPFTFQVGTSYKEFSAGKTYVVEATYDTKSAKLEFLIQSQAEPACLDMLGDDEIIVFTDKENYDHGDVIRISGCLSDKAFTNKVNVAVYDPQGNKIGVSTIAPDSDRTFSDSFVIDEKFGIDGTYSVEADANGLYFSSKSFVVPEFGEVVLVVMSIAVASVVLASSKYSKIMPKL
ncbi:MAG: PEFG-CTERM sorting domain-containing protein [Candidatus Nitrosomaritimum yanchengensis]